MATTASTSTEEKENTMQQIDTIPTDEELEQRRRQERIVALIRRDKHSGEPPTALLLDIDDARQFVALLDLWSSNEALLARFLETPEALAHQYQNWEEFDLFVYRSDDETTRPFFDAARQLIPDDDE